MSYDKAPDRNRRSAREWGMVQFQVTQFKRGDDVYLNNQDSVLHGLRAKVMRLQYLTADLDFGCAIKVPGQSNQTQRVWRLPISELTFTPPEPKVSKFQRRPNREQPR